MAFFCAGSSGEAKKKAAKQGSKPTTNPSKHAIGSIPNGARHSSSTSQSHQPPMPSVQHSNSHSELPPNSRKMIVLQEYSPQDNRGLLVKRGESVQVISQDGNWLFVRNEWGKEGHVPSSHLVAPYSSMRSRSKSTSGVHSIRQVTSGSSIGSSNADSSFSSRGGGVPMQMTQSAGKPRNHDDARRRQVVSPPSLSQNDMTGSRHVVSPPELPMIGGSMSQGTVPYEQKYSPSSSSGVASMNGPLSPSYQSLQQSPSQDNVEPHSSGSSITQDQSSLSSMEEQTLSMETPPTMSNGHTSSSERIRTGRVQSESHLVRSKLHPPHISRKGGISTAHNYTEVVTSETPPPVPPRAGHTSFASNHGEYATLEDRSDPYADPVDAVHQQIPFSAKSNSLRRIGDPKIREVRSANDNGEYTEVYPGPVGTRSRGMNGHHRLHHSQETESEGSSSRRSSKKSSSTCKSFGRGQGEVMHYDPRDVRLNLPDEEERDIDMMPPTGGKHPQTKIHKFRKFVWGVYIVTQEFESLDENEVSVHAGDHVSVFNQDDRDWYWVVKHSTAEEGFVPSCILEETSVPDSQHNTTEAAVSEKPPPLPPKQPLHPTHGQSLYDHTQHFRQRTQSHDQRPPTSIVRRASPASGHRVRGRLNSDGSTPSSLRSSNKAPSVTSIEKVELRDSPPPPYSEFDRHLPPPPPRHFSHSQQSDPSPALYNPHSMHRTRSHGQVHYRRQGVVPPLGGIERTGSDRIVSPDVFQLRSPTTVTGGTLV